MSSPTFPTELWLDIGSYLDQKEHHSLVHVCKNFNKTFTEFLYSDIIIKLSVRKFSPALTESHNSTKSKFAAAGPSAAPLLERLDTHAELRRSVRTISVRNLSIYPDFSPGDWRNDSREFTYDTFVGAIMSLIRECSSLQRVCFMWLRAHYKWVLYLANHPSPHLSLEFVGSRLYGMDSTSLAPRRSASSSIIKHDNATLSFSFQRPSGIAETIAILVELLLSSSLKILDVTETQPSALIGAFILAGRPLLPHLRTLTIPSLDHTELQFLRALPNLRKLSIHKREATGSFGPNDILADNSIIAMLPKLEAISSHNSLIPAFTVGRRIDFIQAEFHRLSQFNHRSVELEAVGPRFGSEVMVRTVEWMTCPEVGGILDYLIVNNPGVWYLKIVPMDDQISEEALISYLPKFAQLPELRTLEFPTLVHVPSARNLAWEMERCQELREMGSKSLVSVSFSSILSWTRHPDDDLLWRPIGPGLETSKLNLMF